ncbi:MAG: hypothetical protein AAF360_08210 [Pseudomonadota bacterium]
MARPNSHVWSALTGDRKREGSRIAPRLVGWTTLAAIPAAGFISTPIAPVQVAGRDAAATSAPTDDVIDNVLIRPGEFVAVGDIAAQIEDAELRSAVQIAEQSVVIAVARVDALSSSAFANADAQRELAVGCAPAPSACGRR